MDYLTGDFIDNEPARRAIRDHYRAKFFSEIGLPVLKDPFAGDPPADQQLSTVLGLFDKAIAMHQDDLSALKSLKMLIESSSFGIPVPRGQLMGRPIFDQVTPRALGTSFFTELWGN